VAILVDTGILVAKHSRTDRQRDRAMEIVAEIVDGLHGTPFLLDAVLVEAVNYAIGRARTPQMALALLDDVLATDGPRWIAVVPSDERLLADAIQFFRTRGAAKGLSLTDCLLVEGARRVKATTIASFDRGFDGFLERIH
jgi:predicted nucleic acid-binding protein